MSRVVVSALIALSGIAIFSSCSSNGGTTPTASSPSRPAQGSRLSQLPLRPAANPAATTHPIAPASPLQGDHPGARLSSTSSALSFASMVGKTITVADVDRFIDSSVTGQDRKIAEQLMWSMPNNMRGDFVYIRKDGSILSNRPAIAQSVVSENITLPTEASRHAMSLTPSQGSDVGTGPYIRERSTSGLTSLMATVTVPCNDIAMFPATSSGKPDTGFTYSGATAGDGSGVDAGLQYNPDGSIQPFISYSGGALWTNQSQHYYCNSTTVGNTGTIGILYGSMTNGTQLFLAVGLPENPPPQTSTWGNNTTTYWDDSAWVYFDTPSSAWDSPGTDSVGQPTVCSSCVVKRVTSIGQSGGENFFDGSCFGGGPPCGGSVSAGVHWGSVEMGQIIQPCPENVGTQSTTCTIQAYQDGRWFGDLLYYSGSNSNALEYTDEETTYASEGWNLGDPTVTFSPNATETYTCSFNNLEQIGKCGVSSYSDWSYTTPSNTQVSSTHPISINLSSMANNGSCGDGLSYTVSLVNPSGTTVYTSTAQTASGFSTSYSASAATGSWKWNVHANNQSGACAGNIYSAGTYNDTATGRGDATFTT
jgi:hypothetical protein